MPGWKDYYFISSGKGGMLKCSAAVYQGCKIKLLLKVRGNVIETKKNGHVPGHIPEGGEDWRGYLWSCI